MIEITDKALQTAAAKGMDEFLRVFTDKYKETVGGDPTAETMPLLNGEQHSLLAYRIFRDEVTEGGFCQLIQNGYGAYIFGNPFARVMRLWGAESFSKLVYRAKKIYDANREDLERERTDEEFMAMYEQYEAFDELEEEYGEMEAEVTETLARYVDGHLDLFAAVIGEPARNPAETASPHRRSRHIRSVRGGISGDIPLKNQKKGGRP